MTLKLPSKTAHEIAIYKCNSYVQSVGTEFSSLAHFHPTISNDFYWLLKRAFFISAELQMLWSWDRALKDFDSPQNPTITVLNFWNHLSLPSMFAWIWKNTVTPRGMYTSFLLLLCFSLLFSLLLLHLHWSTKVPRVTRNPISCRRCSDLVSHLLYPVTNISNN